MVARSATCDWLERGLAAVEALPPILQTVPPVLLRQYDALLPTVTAVARLWGEGDPGRASGAMAALSNPLLRAAGRAAAMEFAAWPSVAVEAALGRAESDYLSCCQGRWLDPARRVDLAETIALAWARQAPDRLDAFYVRLGMGQGPVGLWREQLLVRAARTTLLPPDHLLIEGDEARLVKVALYGLTAGARARACLTLAARARLADQASR